jgi:ATP-dependent helicase/nuclease subunit B
VIARLIEAADAGRTVLTPNTELAAALFDAVERAYREAGREVWPTPRVRDFGGWLRERHVRRQLADSTTERCLSEVEERELWRRAVLESDIGAQFLEPSGAARAARRARRAMAEYGIPKRALAAHGTEESLALLDWSARFADQCRALHCIGGDRLLEQAVETPLGAEVPPLWIESPLWRPVAKAWLKRNAGPPLEPLAAGEAAAVRTMPRYVKADSPAAELAAIADWAYGELKADPQFRAWVCIPDLPGRRAEVVDAFDAALAPQRFSLEESPAGAPYAVAGGIPLADYAPVRGALDFLCAASGAVSFGRFSSLLRAPELQASPSEAAAASRLDAALRPYAPSEAPLGEWLALPGRVARDLPAVAALDRLRAAARALDALSGDHPMSRWLPVWTDALEAGPWGLRQRWSSAEFQSAERFRELLAALAVGDRIFGRHSRQSAESVLRRAARDTPYQEQTGIPPIWVSGQLADPWLAYQGLWAGGCDEQRWPPPADPIPLLPAGLQREYGVLAASVDAQREFAADLLKRWCARARRAVFSCADLGDGRRASPSPLLPVEAALERACAVPQPHWSSALRGAPALEELVDEEAPAFGPQEKTRGVATLRAQSRCAFRGFAETRLRADPLERPLPGINDRERGELLHDALQRIWFDLKSSAGLRERAAPDLTRVIDESARRAIDTLCERRDPGRRWRAREHERLNGLLRRWLELEAARAPFTVERLEEGSEIARHAGLDFSVRVDRIDRLVDGGRILIDYKSGAAEPDWRGDRPDNPQLPLYALLHRESLVAVAYGRINAAECAFVVESGRSDIFPGKRASRLEGVPSFADLIELWSRRIERLAGDFARGRAAVAPTPQACRSCRLQGLCRVPSVFELERPRVAGESALP